MAYFNGKQVLQVVHIGSTGSGGSKPLYGKVYKGTVAVNTEMGDYKWDVYVRFNENSIELVKKPYSEGGVNMSVYIKTYTNGRKYQIIGNASPDDVVDEMYTFDYHENVARIMCDFTEDVGLVFVNLYIFSNSGNSAKSVPYLPIEAYEGVTTENVTGALLMVADAFRGDLEYSEEYEAEFNDYIVEKGWTLPTD